MSGLAAALLTLPLLPSVAAAQLAVSSNDGKAVLVNGVNTVPPNPADDTVTIIDLGAVDTEGIYDGRTFKTER